MLIIKVTVILIILVIIIVIVILIVTENITVIVLVIVSLKCTKWHSESYAHCVEFRKGSDGLTSGLYQSIDLLIVGIPPVPGEAVLQFTVRFKDPFIDESFNQNPQPDGREVRWNPLSGQEDHDRRHVSGCFAATVDQVDICSRYP